MKYNWKIEHDPFIVQISKVGLAPLFDQNNPDFEFELKANPYCKEVGPYFEKRKSRTVFGDFIDFRGEFTLDGFLDVLAAPTFVLRKKMKANFHYPPDLVKLFDRLFPSPEAYSKALLDHLKFASNEIDEEVNGYETKDKPLGYYDGLQKRLSQIRNDFAFKLKPSLKEFQDVAISIIENLETRLLSLTNWVNELPVGFLRNNYYLLNPDESREEDPLAFFRDFLYNGGYERMYHFYSRETLSSDLLPTLWDELDIIYRAEAQNSLKFIKIKLKNKNRQAKQSIITSVCNEILFYCYRSLVHSVHTDKRFLEPFKFLIAKLKANYPDYHFPDMPDFDESVYDSFVSSAKFIKELIKLKIKNKFKEEMEMFRGKVNVLNMGQFIDGNFEEMGRLNFNWDGEQVYYLVNKLNYYGAKINFHSNNERYTTILRENLWIKDTEFDVETFYKTNSKYKDAPKGQRKFKAIDEFFEQEARKSLPPKRMKEFDISFDLAKKGK